jgi:hypothetical protein
MKIFIKLFFFYNCYCQDYKDIFKYLSQEFLKKNFFIINYYNSIPKDLLKQIYSININILDNLKKNNYQLIVVKEKINNNYQFNLIVTQDKLGKIYDNSIKHYIKINIPTNLPNNNKYQILNNHIIKEYNIFSYQDNQHLVIVSNIDFSYIQPINKSNTIKSSVNIKKHNQWNYLILQQKNLWFIEKIFYKIKDNQLVLKIFYTYDFKFNHLQFNSLFNKNKSHFSIANIFNTSENLLFFPIDTSGYNINNNNPQYLSFNNLVITENSNNKTNYRIFKDIPLITYIIILYYEKYFNYHNNQSFNDNKDFIQEYEKKFNEIKNIYFDIYHIKDLKKYLDIFPTFPIYFLDNITYDNNNLINYINMILNFFYDKHKDFQTDFNNFFIENNYKIFPLINSINKINEELFWNMMNLITYNKLSNNNLALMVRYSYGFPSIIRDKINSFIIYNLFLLDQWHAINYLFENNLIDFTLDFYTNYIYVKSKVFNGFIKGQDILNFNKNETNLLESHLIIKKFLYNKNFNSNLLKNIEKIINLYETYKIILTKQEENQLFVFLSYIGKLDYNFLKKITQQSRINIDLVIDYVYFCNPKLYDKYFKK